MAFFCFLFVFLVSFVFVYFLLLFTALLKLGEGVRSVMAHLSRNFPVHRLSTRFPRGGARARMLGEQRAKQKKGVFLATEIGECAYISRNMPRQHVVKTCLFLERVWFLFFRSVFFFFLTSRRNPFTSAYFAGAHRGGAAQRIRECLVLLA